MEVDNSTIKRKSSGKDNNNVDKKEKSKKRFNVTAYTGNTFAFQFLNIILQTKQNMYLQLLVVVLFAFVNTRWRERPVAPLSHEMFYAVGIACVSFMALPLASTLLQEVFKTKLDPHFSAVPGALVLRCLSILASHALLRESMQEVRGLFSKKKFHEKKSELEGPARSVVLYQGFVLIDFFERILMPSDHDWSEFGDVVKDQALLHSGWYLGTGFGNVLGTILTPLVFGQSSA